MKRAVISYSFFSSSHHRYLQLMNALKNQLKIAKEAELFFRKIPLYYNVSSIVLDIGQKSAIIN